MNTEKKASKNERYPNFDLLRLLLALEVVVAHAWHMADPTFEWSAYVMAVPAFLAISGFLVLKSYEESGAWTIFIRKRARRLLPALLVSFLLCLVLFDWLATFNALLTWMTGGLYQLDGILVANGPLWSLAWEEFAYLCLALLWMAGAYRQPLVIWALFVLSLLFIGFMKEGLAPNRLVILYLMPAFFIGNLAYLHRDVLLKVHPAIPWAFLLSVLLNNKIPFYHELVLLSRVSFEAFSVVWVGMAGFRLVRFRFPDISYGLYIYHWPISVYLVMHKIAQTPLDLAKWLPMPLLAVCLVSWYIFEKPAIHSTQSSFRKDATGWFPNFELIRLLLALQIVLAHTLYLLDTTSGWSGFVSTIPAFLAISGVLVLKSAEETTDWINNTKNRALRVLPALTASMALCWMLFDWTSTQGSLTHLVSGGLVYHRGVINAPLWSLVWGTLAYICMMLLLAGGAYKRPLIIWILLFITLLIVREGKSLHPQIQLILQLMPAFFIGNLAYLHRKWLLKVDSRIPWLFLIIVIFSPNISYVGPVINHNGATQVFFQAFAITWVGIAGLQAVSFRFPDISFGLYVFHWPIIGYLLKQQLVTTGAEMALWLPIALLAASLVSWYLIEKPALRLKHKTVAHTPVGSAAH